MEKSSIKLEILDKNLSINIMSIRLGEKTFSLSTIISSRAITTAFKIRKHNRPSFLFPNSETNVEKSNSIYCKSNKWNIYAIKSNNDRGNFT